MARVHNVSKALLTNGIAFVCQQRHTATTMALRPAPLQL